MKQRDKRRIARIKEIKEKVNYFFRKLIKTENIVFTKEQLDEIEKKIEENRKRKESKDFIGELEKVGKDEEKLTEEDIEQKIEEEKRHKIVEDDLEELRKEQEQNRNKE